MTEQEFYTALCGTGLVVNYDHAPKGTRLPFIVYTWASTPSIYADNYVYDKKAVVRVRLVCETKADINVYSEVIEDIFKTIRRGWSVSEAFIESEKTYERIYDLEV